LLIVNEHHLRQLMAEYLLQYNTARPHGNAMGFRAKRCGGASPVGYGG
jgi:hypothetical protein